MTKLVAFYFGAPLELSGADAAGGLPSKFTGIAYSGGLVPGHNAVIDLATTSVSKRMHLLHEHVKTDIIGVIENSANDGRNITVSGKVFSDIKGSSAEAIAQRAQRGSPYEMSVGLYGFKHDLIEPDMEVEINGQKFTGPVTVMRHGKVRESSVCALGADPATDVELFSAPEATQESAMTEAEAKALRDQLAALTAANEKLKTDAKAADEARKAELSAAREVAIAALVQATGGAPLEPAEKTALLAMGEVEFGTMAKRMKAQAERFKTLDPKLFTEQATGDAAKKTEDEQRQAKAIALLSDPDAIYQKRAEQAAKAVSGLHFNS